MQTCLVSDRKGNNIHTFQTVEFESDLYRSCSLQDCLATIPPHPFYIGERDDNYDVAESLFDQDSM